MSHEVLLIKIKTKDQGKTSPTSSNMLHKNVGCLCRLFWMMLDQHFFHKKMLDESLKKFKHSSNISIAFF